MIVRLKPFRQISPLKLETSLSCQRIHDSVLSFSVHHLRSCTQGTKSSVKLNHTWLVSHIGSHFAHDRINHLILFSLAPCYTQSSCTVIQICTYRRQVFVLSGHADQGATIAIACLLRSHSLGYFNHTCPFGTTVASMQSWTCMGCSVAKTWDCVSRFQRL